MLVIIGLAQLHDAHKRCTARLRRGNSTTCRPNICGARWFQCGFVVEHQISNKVLRIYGVFSYDYNIFSTANLPG